MAAVESLQDDIPHFDEETCQSSPQEEETYEVPSDRNHIIFAIRHGSVMRIPDTRDIEIYRTVDRNITFVVKHIDANKCHNSSIQKTLLDEGKVLGRLNHKNIIPIHFYLHPRIPNTDSSDLNKIDIFLPYMRGGDLLRFTSQTSYLSPADIGTIMGKLVNAVWYLHHIAYIVHRDIKPENILLEDPNDFTSLKLCDFGYASPIEVYGDHFSSPSFAKEGNPGTPLYSAPEVFSDYQTRFPKAADCWALGATLFTISEKRHPFPGQTKEQIMHKHATTAIARSSFVNLVDKVFVDSLCGLLCQTPEYRTTIDQLKKVISSLSH